MVQVDIELSRRNFVIAGAVLAAAATPFSIRFMAHDISFDEAKYGNEETRNLYVMQEYRKQPKKELIHVIAYDHDNSFAQREGLSYIPRLLEDPKSVKALEERGIPREEAEKFLKGKSMDNALAQVILGMVTLISYSERQDIFVMQYPNNFGQKKSSSVYLTGAAFEDVEVESNGVKQIIPATASWINLLLVYARFAAGMLHEGVTRDVMITSSDFHRLYQEVVNAAVATYASIDTFAEAKRLPEGDPAYLRAARMLGDTFWVNERLRKKNLPRQDLEVMVILDMLSDKYRAAIKAAEQKLSII